MNIAFPAVPRSRAIAASGLALGAAFAVGFLVIAFSGGDPGRAAGALVYGAFGTRTNAAGTLIKSVPLLLTGLSVALAFRVGLFNIGGEGQLYVGALAAAALGAADLGLPRIVHLPLVLIAALVAGGLWGAIPGWLRASRGVHEVINTIMLNYVAIQATDYLVNGPLNAGGYAVKTKPLVAPAKLPSLWDVPPISVSWGIVIATVACLAGAWLLFHTPLGYELRAVGHNPEAAEATGIRPGSRIVIGMILAGAAAGLAGALEITGVHHTMYAQFSPGYGFDGIAVALLARNHPVGILPAALLFGALRTADRWLQLSTGVARDIVVIIQAVALLAVGIQSTLTRRRTS